MCFAIIESAHASMPFKTRCELTRLRLAKDRQRRRPRMSLFHGLSSLSGFYLNEIVTEGFVCVSRAGMPETETKSLAPAFRLSFASHPLKWRFSLLRWKQNLCSQEVQERPAAEPDREGVFSLLFALVGGGNLASDTKITAPGEAKSWNRFFAETNLRPPLPHLQH